MFQKIQPEQIQLHEFSSPSGDLRFDVGSNYVYANLSRALTGNFSIDGNLSVNGYILTAVDETNTFDNTVNFIGRGTDNYVVGSGNGILFSVNSTIYGTENAIVNGQNCYISTGSKKNSVIGGYCSLYDVTGTTVLHDQTDPLAVNRSNSLYVSFKSGVLMNAPLFLQNHTFIDPFRHLFLSSTSSGIFSGNVGVSGTLYLNGSYATTQAALDLASGTLNSGLVALGAGSSVLLTGNQNISGNKTFYNNIETADSSIITATGTRPNYIDLLDQGNTIATGKTLKIAGDNAVSVIFNANNGSSKDNLATQTSASFNSSFVISSENEDIDSAKNQAVFDSFGNCRLRGALIVKNSGSIIPTSNADSGVDGLFARSGEYFFIKDNASWVKFKGQKDSWNEPSGQLWLDGLATTVAWQNGRILNEGIVNIFSSGSGVSGFTGNAVGGNLQINGTTALSWTNGLVTTPTYSNLNLLSGNGKNGSYSFPTSPTTQGTIEWTNGQITSTGNLSPNGGSGSLRYTGQASPSVEWFGGIIATTGSVLLPFPPAGWEEMTMNFTDADGFLRTRTFLVKTP